MSNGEKLYEIIVENIRKERKRLCILMQRSQINNYCNNQITRLDIDVLARICTVLNCSISDLLEFIPPEENE